VLDVNVCVGVCLYYCCCCNRILDAAGLLTRPSLRSVLGLVEQVRTNQSIYTRSQLLNSNICLDTPRTAEDAEYDECVTDRVGRRPRVTTCLRSARHMPRSSARRQ
jgi:hypothetical protein